MPIDPAQTPVAHGDRREEVHFEDSPDHVARVSHLFKPDRPLPPDMAGSASDASNAQPATPPQDVAVAPDTPSVWDASPPERP